MSSRKIAVFLADTHAGHRLGLMRPGLELYEEDEAGNLSPYSPELTATQQHLWRAYQDDIQSVRDLADGDEILVFHVGDLTQGKKYPTQLVTTRTADQLTIARANIEEWLHIENVSSLRLVVGTASHILGEASSPVLLLQMLEPAFPDRDLGLCRHGRPVIDGVIVDCAHHGPSSGIREWTQGNQLRYYLKSLVIHDVMRGKHWPHLVIRAHFHKLWPEAISFRLSTRVQAALRAVEFGVADGLLDELRAADQVQVFQSRIVLLPSYCGMGEYGRQATGSSPSLSNGLVAAEIVDGELGGVHYYEREVDLRRGEEF